MEDKLLFVNSFKSNRSNGTNRAYWTKLVRNMVNSEVENLFSVRFDACDSEQKPVFSCIVKEKKRALIIYQYNPSLVPQGELCYEKYITAWTSQRTIHGQRINILTICLVPSKKNTQTSKELIKTWFEKRQSIKGLITQIYEKQEATYD